MTTVISAAPGPGSPAPDPRRGEKGGRVVLSERFDADVPPGHVIGSAGPGGIRRCGADAEGALSIDNGALRIGMMARAGWGRAGVSYGPLERRPGLALAALVLNGHNASQTYRMEAVHRRFGRWVLGVPGADPLWRRTLRWPLRQRRESVLGQAIRWLAHCRTPRAEIRDNLMVGFFPDEAPGDGPARGHALIMRAASHENGELRARVAGASLPISRNIQDIPIHYIVVLRERGAVYYAASLPGAFGLGGYPRMRPVAIDPEGPAGAVYAGVHQSVLSEIGFSNDTRVHGLRVAEVPELGEGWGSAHAADDMAGSGPLDGSGAGVGGVWSVLRGGAARLAAGSRPGAGGVFAVLDPGIPSGLLSATVECGRGCEGGGLVWRARDAGNCWMVRTGGGDGTKGEVGLMESGEWRRVAELRPREPGPALVQVIDDGCNIGVSINGTPVCDPIADERMGSGTGAGLWGGAGALLGGFEAHPRSVPVPRELDLGPSWCVLGGEVAVRDGFVGPPGDLAGRRAGQGAGRSRRTAPDWRRDLGRGVIELTGSPGGAAQVRASTRSPNPGRTIYTVAWPFPEFADLQVDMTPPGTARGQGHKGRTGLVFMQDRNNYIVVNLWLDDCYGGATFSSFFYLNGHENLYDAVWSNIGPRVSWGRPFRFRITFDGLYYLVMCDGEPVMYRSLRDVYPRVPRLAINRVGLCANWEFGDDTGTRLERFVARRLGTPSRGE